MSGETRKAVWAALIGNLLITVSKFAAGMLSGSVAMLSEAAHSFADTFNQVFLLVGLNLGAKPADEEHPFGHGKERFFWTFITALMIFSVGAFFSIYEGSQVVIETLKNGEHVRSASWVSYITLAVAMVFETISFSVAIREMVKGARASERTLITHYRESEDLTIKTVLFEDAAALAGIIIAFAGIMLAGAANNRIYDGLASILIGFVLIAVALYLSFESRGLLIGQAASITKRTAIREAIENWPTVTAVHEILTMHIAPDSILLTANIELAPDLGTRDIELEICEMEKAIVTVVPEVKKSFIEPSKLSE